MIIRKAQVCAAGKNYSGLVELTLAETSAGWTYEIDGMRGEPLSLTWRTKTPEQAARKLREIYRGDAWVFRVIDPAPEKI